MRLPGKVAIVTGSASGIGRGIARLFAREGCGAVVVADCRVDWGKETVRMIKDEDGEAIFVQVDVAVATDVQRMVDEAVQHFGRLDILVNNAFWMDMTPVVEMSEEGWDRTLDVTLKAVFLGAKYAIPEMIKCGGGSIVNISSVNGIISNRRFGAYSAAKGGMNILTKQLAMEYGPSGIRVNAICPGIIETEAVANLWREHPEDYPFAVDCCPIGRVGTVKDVAYAALYLASDEASFVTGSILVVDGGMITQSPEAMVRPTYQR